MYGYIKNYIQFFMVIVICSCQISDDSSNSIEVQVHDIYFDLSRDNFLVPRNQIEVYLISNSKDTLEFNIRCTRCPKKKQTNSLAFITLNNDTISVFSRYTTNISIPPFDTLPMSLTYDIFSYQNQKSSKNNQLFAYQYTMDFLDTLVKQPIQYNLEESDYEDVIPKVRVTKASILNIHYQDKNYYRFKNNH